MTKAKNESAFNYDRNARLRLLRYNNDLSQEETAAKIGFSAQYFSRVERGMYDGSVEFWRNLKNTFNISDSEIWAYIENYPIKETNETKKNNKGG